jgi:hypothetical protein
MTRFFIRILLSLMIGWWIGVEIGWTFWPENNLGPLVPILAAIPLTYLASYLIVPLFTGWLDRLR